MDVGLFAPTSTPAATPALLRAPGPAAQARGFASLWVPEHVVAIEERHAGTLDPFVALAFLAATTTTIRLGTGVALVSQRHPVFAAKEAAPIHVGGHSDAALRRVAAVGQGWYAFGIDVPTFAAKLAALDAALAARGRTRAEVRVSVCPFGHPSDADALRRYRDAGADQVILPDAVTATAATMLPVLDRLARVAESARAA